jgi:hypothetical protein
MAPELLQDEKYTAKGPVWTFPPTMEAVPVVAQAITYDESPNMFPSMSLCARCVFALEAEENRRVLCAVDVFSFGMLLYALVAGRSPWSGMGRNGGNLKPVQVGILLSNVLGYRHHRCFQVFDITWEYIPLTLRLTSRLSCVR